MLFYATFRLYNLLVGGLIFLGDCKSPKEWLGHFLTTEYKSVETPNGHSTERKKHIAYRLKSQTIKFEQSDSSP